MSFDLASGASSTEDELTPTPCATDIDLFLNPLLEDPPVRSKTPSGTWRDYEALVVDARTACSSCRLLADCLYKAVVHTDVSGYVGCTTPKERVAIRKVMGVKVEAEDLDAFTGSRGSRQPVNHEDVLRMRAQHPDDSLEALAGRLGCSLSTVKRHLRRARSEVSDDEQSAALLPTMDDVFEAFEQVVESNRAASRAC
jgi:hypothetical protein